MSSEIELFSDGDGVAIFGDPKEVERFLSGAGVASKELTLGRSVGTALKSGSGAAQAGSQIAAHSGRWVQLTEESAKALKLGNAMKGSSTGVSRAVATTSKGKITKILEFTKPGSVGSMLTNPAVLAGAAGIMAQLAMEQTMEEITQYLAVIDEKVDDILRAQKDAALAEMVGVGMILDDAMIKRQHVGSVSATTWSNLHGAAQKIATTQAYALRRLDALAEKMEKKRDIAELAKVTQEASETVNEWLAVLARCFQMQDGLAVLELDRVLDSDPHDLDRHREAIQIGRRRRRDLIATSTQCLLERIDAAAGVANTKVLLHPIKANAIVHSANKVGGGVSEFNSKLGIGQSRAEIEPKPWREAVGDAKNTVVNTAGAGASATARFGAGTYAHAKVAGDELTQRIRARLPQRQAPLDTEAEPESDDR
ncbi:hypothetical protein [Leucobacter sp. cx-169]|uniref:hypothetical protein n=1 Tax=Leucobacter sp. cx-169 TaxID=2770549 RepID=UPI00165DAB38|nr:hypothetical protein [Leucobacter sp. cx-169]MBC9927356.1 hypothetical protein [Leucobacter sp. cx-169]